VQAVVAQDLETDQAVEVQVASSNQLPLRLLRLLTRLPLVVVVLVDQATEELTVPIVHLARS
jgi:hypothetical protein|tara:strand:+ start:871 stop:1056 length:186 start_codon:yes stop_codon:yes gene_type:complete